MLKYDDPYGPYDGPDNEDPTCSICGSSRVEWVDCPQCGGEGWFDEEDLMEEDPLWYQPGDYEMCRECGGNGGWWQCLDAENHAKEATNG